MTPADPTRDEDLVPVSVRLGEVVPPEDPEDWTRPLTWAAALGMLAAPLVAFAWFLLAPPDEATHAGPMTAALAAVLAGGAAGTGATQLGTARAATGTLGSGLFASLVVIMLGVVMAGERQVGVASPTLSHAFAAAVSGMAGVGIGSIVAAVSAGHGSRPVRFVVVATVAVIAALVAVTLLMPAAPAALTLGD